MLTRSILFFCLLLVLFTINDMHANAQIVVPVYPNNNSSAEQSIQMKTFGYATITPTPDVASEGNSTQAGQPSNVNQAALSAVELARKQIGKPYSFATPSRNWSTLDPNKGKTPRSFDCSGLVGWAWYWATNGKVKMAGQTHTDWRSGKYQKFGPNDRAKLQPGDLLYWGPPSNIHHTGIWSGKCLKSAGNDCFIEAQQTGVPIKESHFRSREFAGFLRVLQ